MMDPGKRVTSMRPPGGGIGGGNTNQKEQETETELDNKYQPEGGNDGGETKKKEPELENKTRPENTAQNMTNMRPEKEAQNRTSRQNKERRTSVADKIKAFTQLDLGGPLQNIPEKQPINLVQKPRPETTEPETRSPKNKTLPDVAQEEPVCTPDRHKPAHPPPQFKLKPPISTPPTKTTRNPKPKPDKKWEIPENQPRISSYTTPTQTQLKPDCSKQKPTPETTTSNPKYKPVPTLAPPRLKPPLAIPDKPTTPTTTKPEPEPVTSTPTIQKYKPQPTIAEPKLKLLPLPPPPKTGKPGPPKQTRPQEHTTPDQKKVKTPNPTSSSKTRKPGLKSKHGGKDISDLNTLKEFLARKKLERDKKLLIVSASAALPVAHTGASSSKICTPSRLVSGESKVAKPNRRSAEQGE